jgi:Na+-transporting NADH:ubiquinone oxidoreductase subunit C
VKAFRTGNETIFMGYEADGKIFRGYAIPINGQGFWGPVSGMVAVDPGISSIIGLAFYKHSETPGLGGRLTENWFTDQFRGLKLSPASRGETIFRLLPAGTGTAPNDLDAITGATMTSNAVTRILNRNLVRFIQEIRPKMEGK